MTGKKKQVDFMVRPRANPELPPTSEQWVQQGQGDVPSHAKEEKEEKEKRLTLNLPVRLHTAFKSKCVYEDETIQERVRFLIERDVADWRQPIEGKPGAT